MSLFDDFKQWEVITNTRQLWSYHRIIKKQKETAEEKEAREKEEWKALNKQKRAELSEEEYNEWYKTTWYQRNREKRLAYQYEWLERQKQEQEEILKDVFETVYDIIPEPIDLDDYYQEKFKADNVNKEWKYRFGRRHSRIMWMHWKFIPAMTQPIRISNRWGMTHVLARTLKTEQEAYKYLLPHMWEISLDDFFLKRKKRQIVSKYPYWNMNGKIKELAENTKIPHSHLCNVASAILRDKYIASEVYLWRNSFLVGDVIVTQTWWLFQVSLKNNLKRLTEETIEDVHKKRMERIYNNSDEPPPLYRLQDAYLIRIKPNEREDWFYIVPY